VVRPEGVVVRLEAGAVPPGTEAVEVKGEVFWAWVVPPEKDSGESTRERDYTMRGGKMQGGNEIMFGGGIWLYAHESMIPGGVALCKGANCGILVC
jgi:hypothetical protein